MSQPDPKLLLLAGHGLSARVVAAELANHFELAAVLRESPVPRRQMARRRLRRLGATTVADQLAFQLVIKRFLDLESRARAEALLEDFGWSDPSFPVAPVDVPSVNSDVCRRLIAEVEPTVVVISGTRILGKKTLAAAEGPILNVHAGLTPRYRGVHGAYWALAEGRPDLAGVTVHRVDAGIDTGAVLGQARIRVDPRDNFATYPILQLKAGLGLLIASIRRLAAGEVWSEPPLTDHAPLRYHPRASSYLFNRWLYGVR